MHVEQRKRAGTFFWEKGMKTHTVGLICIAALAGSGADSALAQSYPSRAVRIVVAQAAGAQSDLFTRLLGQKLGESLGQSVISDPRPGAGGAIGAEMVARAAPDGYTLLMATNSTHSSNPALYAKLPYDPVKDFSPITLTVGTPYVMTVHPSLPVTTLKEFVAFAKARPGQLNYASAGNGSTHHLCGELLKSMTGINIVHVPYKGGPPSTMAVLGGEASMHFSSVSALHPHIKNGKLKAQGVTAAKRSSLLPEVPTLSEAGLPGFEMLSWFGLLAPAATPQMIVSRLNAETIKALSTPDMKSTVAAQGSEVMAGTPEQFGDYIKSEIARIAKIAKTAGIKAE
jgi:tripartite-type tricarboxylate transporter receptor subunit TctC